ncbi:MAG TPA: TolC family protein [Candidatus Binataceae bacterium]|nr:TolC family protein [Candidatus Binataceae bacterium]
MKRVHFTGSFILMLAIFPLATVTAPEARAQDAGRLTLDQLITEAMQNNPGVKSARERWLSASHQIQQNYAPADPVFSYSNTDSPDFPLFKASAHTIGVTQSLQFPGKALYQADLSRRTADIARLALEATERDLRAQVQVGYYQLALDAALAAATEEQANLLEKVVKVTEIGYQGNKNTQADIIAAQLAYSTMVQQLEVFRLNVQNDRTQINMLLYRRPDEPLTVDQTLDVRPLTAGLDDLIRRAAETRQEILQAALTERNSDTASTLAKMEYLPDYSLSYSFDDYLLTSAAPAPNRTEDHSLTLAFNVPIFFRWHQREDVVKSLHDLEAARYDLGSIKNQTSAIVTTLYRTALVDYRQARLYHDSLIPIARHGYEVAIVAYENGQLNFAQLQNAYQQLYSLQVSHLQLQNQFLAQKVAIEQTVGSPLPQ